MAGQAEGEAAEAVVEVVVQVLDENHPLSSGRLSSGRLSLVIDSALELT